MFWSKNAPAKSYADGSCSWYSPVASGWCNKRIGEDGPYPIPVCWPCYERATHTALHGPALWDKLGDEFGSELRARVKAQMQRPAMADAIIDGNDMAKEVHELQTRVFALIKEGKQTEAQALNREVEKRMGEILRFRKETATNFAQLEGRVSDE